MKLNEIERKVLGALADAYDPYDGFGFLGFAGIESRTEGLDRKQIRRAARSLARKGLAEYQRGLWDIHGEMAGSGYGCTKQGAALMEGK
jgi:hypothetical protein